MNVQEQHICDVCGKVFKKKAHLIVHSRTHSIADVSSIPSSNVKTKGDDAPASDKIMEVVDTSWIESFQRNIQDTFAQEKTEPEFNKTQLPKLNEKKSDPEKTLPTRNDAKVFVPPPPLKPPPGRRSHEDTLRWKQLNIERDKLQAIIRDLELQRTTAVSKRLDENKDLPLQEVEWKLREIRTELDSVRSSTDEFIDSRTISKNGMKQRWAKGELLARLEDLEEEYAVNLEQIIANIHDEEDRNSEYGKHVTRQMKEEVKRMSNAIKLLREPSEDEDAIGAEAYHAHVVDPYPERAENLYLKCLEINPHHATNLGNYALFIHHFGSSANGPYKTKETRKYKGEVDEISKLNDTMADEFYKKALIENPEHAINLSNYASFLRTNMRSLDRAEQYYERAIKYDPNNTCTLGNFAKFLFKDRRDFLRAEALFKKALELDPNHVNNLINYAALVKKVHNKFELASVLYERALELAPENATALANFANLLAKYSDPSSTDDSNIERIEQAKSLYVKALQVTPNHAAIKRNYAIFLRDFSVLRNTNPASPARRRRNGSKATNPVRTFPGASLLGTLTE